MRTMGSSTSGSRRTLQAAGLSLRGWSARQYEAAAGFSVAFGLLIGIPTVLIPNPVFGREVPVVAWNYPVWIASSVLAGMLAATYVRPTSGMQAPPESADTVDAPSRLGMLGAVLAWFAPAQPYLAAVALLTTAGALLVRLRGQILRPTPRQGDTRASTARSTSADADQVPTRESIRPGAT